MKRLVLPATTNSRTRAERVRWRLLLGLAALLAILPVGRVELDRTLDVVAQLLRAEGLLRNSIAPAFIASTAMRMSPKPVTTIVGNSMPRATISFCNSRPLMPGMRTSTTRHPGPLGE